MLFVCVLFCFLSVQSYAANVGDLCTKDGQTGVCTILNKCFSAIREIKYKKNPQSCGFSGQSPIVCCLDSDVPRAPTTQRLPPLVTTERPSRPKPPIFVPPDYDYVQTGGIYPGCAPIPIGWTSDKTGQKAFDKCIEYQERLVYPCERSVTFSDDMVRGYHCHHNPDQLTSGVVNITRNELPHIVSLGYGDRIDEAQWLCTGAIISERYVLTAGHCTKILTAGDLNFVLLSAAVHREANSEIIYQVKNIIRHPNYDLLSRNNDIALLELEILLPLSQFLVPACLDVEGAEATRVLASYWQNERNISDTMQKVVLEKVSTKECAGLDISPQTQLCYEDRTQDKDSCQGDNGGPVQTKSKQMHCMYTIVGVTSFRQECDTGTKPAIYTRVANYVPWIENIVWP